jgi:hypothetical protein
MAAVADRITNGQVTLGGESAGVTMEPSSTVDAAAGGRRSSRCLVQAMPVTTSGFRRASAHRPGTDKRHVARRGGDDLWGGGGGGAHRGHPDVSAPRVSMWCACRTLTVWPGLSRRGAVAHVDWRGNIRTSGLSNPMADRLQNSRQSQVATELKSGLDPEQEMPTVMTHPVLSTGIVIIDRPASSDARDARPRSGSSRRLPKAESPDGVGNAVPEVEVGRHAGCDMRPAVHLVKELFGAPVVERRRDPLDISPKPAPTMQAPRLWPIPHRRRLGRGGSVNSRRSSPIPSGVTCVCVYPEAFWLASPPESA